MTELELDLGVLDDLSRHPGINVDLITDYFNKGDLRNLLTVFDFLRRATLRAEALSRAYQAQMFELHRRLDAERSSTGVTISKPRKIVIDDEPKPVKYVKPPKGNIIDIEL
jgi:hypothetical protein